MKTIELTDKQYRELLVFKNFVSLKTRQITNDEVLNRSGSLAQISMFSRRLRKRFDYEPEYSFGECIDDAIGCIWNEQKTGEVNYIT